MSMLFRLCTAVLLMFALLRPAGEAAAQTVTGSATPNAPIRDNQTTTSTIGLTENIAVGPVSLTLDIVHTYRGDLVVSLTSPAGTRVAVSNREGGSADNIQGTFTLSDFKGQQSAGTWTLTVEDRASGDTGTLRAWSLSITPPAPPNDRDPMQHLEYLASDAMGGRNSPSTGLDAAGNYVRDLLVKYGLTGPNPTDSTGPYFQSFTYGTFAPATQGLAADGQEHDGHDHAHGPKEFGHTLFESGIYLSDRMGPEAREALRRHRTEALRARGLTVTEPSSDAELLQQVQLAGNVRNVLGKLEGSGPNRDEVIVVMAHLDHIGKSSTGAVYNGADDNASGSSVLLSALPDLSAAAAAGELNRSVLFLWTAAEEKGLVGAQYFVDHPIAGLELDKVVGVINMDMVGRWDAQRISVIDLTAGAANYWRTLVDQANADMSDPFDRVNRDIQTYYDRQDGAVFSRKGEDVLFVFEGLSNPAGGGSLIPEYHATGDDVSLIYRDNNGDKPRRMRDLLIRLVKRATNR